MKVEVKLRSDNERGLFAIEDIKKGDLVCILPIDYLQLDDNWYTTQQTTSTLNRIDFRYGILCEIDKKKEFENQFQNFHLFFKESIYKCCLFKTYDKIELIGVSNRYITDGLFIGHMINDYVDMSFLSEKKYEKMSLDFSNVKVSSKLEIFDQNRLGLKIKATKDIKNGKELYLTYGPEYWKKYSGKDKFIYSVETTVIVI
jgi:hypothetical protein